MKHKKTTRSNRRGATAVEFAIVAPVAFAFIFGLLEISNIYRIDGSLTTAILNGGREASIRTSETADVEAAVRDSLELVGVRTSNITINPADFDSNTETIDIAVEFDATAGNGFYIRKFFTGPMRREITINRF